MFLLAFLGLSLGVLLTLLGMLRVLTVLVGLLYLHDEPRVPIAQARRRSYGWREQW